MPPARLLQNASRCSCERCYETLGAAAPLLDAGTDMFSQLIHAFYDPGFSFRRFLDRYPEQRKALIDCLVGDVFKDMTSFSQALGEMTG